MYVCGREWYIRPYTNLSSSERNGPATIFSMIWRALKSVLNQKDAYISISKIFDAMMTQFCHSPPLQPKLKDREEKNNQLNLAIIVDVFFFFFIFVWWIYHQIDIFATQIWWKWFCKIKTQSDWTVMDWLVLFVVEKKMKKCT